MNRILSVDKSLLADGTVRYYVTMETGNGGTTQIEVGEAEARRFQRVLQSQQGGGPRLLTETLPMT